MNAFANKYDLLLHWLSAVRPPGRGKLNTACRWLAHRRAAGDPPSSWELLRPLVQLGHVDPTGDRSRPYAAAPPVLVWDKASGGSLHGARLQSWPEKLAAYDGVSFNDEPSDDGPSRWRLTGERSTVEAACERLGVRPVVNRGAELLAALPTVGEVVRKLPCAATPPAGEGEWERFDPRASGRWWHSAGSRAPDLPGLYRVRPSGGTGPRRHVHLGEAGWAELNPMELRRVAQVHELSARSVAFDYDPQSRRLRVGWTLARCLPTMVDRPLCLAAGRTPRCEGNHFLYDHVSPDLARHAGRVLNLDLKE